MKANREKFKQFVTEQLKDYDEWREASPDGYAEIIRKTLWLFKNFTYICNVN